MLSPQSLHFSEFLFPKIRHYQFMVSGDLLPPKRILSTILCPLTAKKRRDDAFVGVVPLAELHLKTNDGELMPEGAV
jgi:hypothetical protein